MGDPRRSLRNALEGALGAKEDKLKTYQGLLGAYVDTRPTVPVSGRSDYVWVRLRGSTSEPIQAYNDEVGQHFDLPVIVARDRNNPRIWRVMGRDVGQYQDWGGQSSASYIPPHGLTHSCVCVAAPGTGNDPVWVYSRQFMPLLMRPDNTGTNSAYLEPGYFLYKGQYSWWPGSGTQNFDSFKPTGSYNALFVTVSYEADTGILLYEQGQEFNAYSTPGAATDFIPFPSQESAIPIASIFLLTGTRYIGWDEIFHIRDAKTILPSTGSVLAIADEGLLLGSIGQINFEGAGVTVTVSGTYADVTIPGGGGGGGGGGAGVVGWDDGIFVGTGTIVDWGLNLDVTLSGTVLRIDATDGLVDRVVEDDNIRLVPDTHSIVVSSYFEVEAGGTLELEGDASLDVV